MKNWMEKQKKASKKKLADKCHDRLERDKSKIKELRDYYGYDGGAKVEYRIDDLEDEITDIENFLEPDYDDLKKEVENKLLKQQIQDYRLLMAHSVEVMRNYMVTESLPQNIMDELLKPTFYTDRFDKRKECIFGMDSNSDNAATD